MAVSDNQADGKPGGSSSGDVDDLVSSLQLQGLQYREFSVRKPAVLEFPTDPLTRTERIDPPAPPKVTALGPRPLDPTRVQPDPPVASQVAPKVLATPVNSAFERLRRQVIGSRGDGIMLSLRLPARPALAASDGQPLLQRPIAAVFAQLLAAGVRHQSF